MTGSRNRARGVLLLSVFGALAAVPVRAEAPLSLLPPVLDPRPAAPLVPESGGPIPLGTAGFSDPTPSISRPGGNPGLLGTPLEAPPSDQTMPRGAALPAPVEAHPLDETPIPGETPALGETPLLGGTPLLGETQGALAPDLPALPPARETAGLWQGEDETVLRSLVEAIPAVPSARAGLALAERLFGEVGGRPGFAAVAIAWYQAAGRAEALSGFRGVLDALPAAAVSAVVAGLAALEDRAALCAAGFEALGASGLNPDVLRALALCRAVAGNGDGAQVALDLAHEQGPVSDNFDRLVRALAGRDRAGLGDIDPADSLDLWAAEGLGLPPPVREGTPALLLPRLARLGASLEIRIGAAERAEQRGLVTADRLAALYGIGPAPTAALPAMPEELRRSALHRAVVEASGPAVRAQAVVAFVEAAGRAGLAATAARVESRAIDDVAGQSLPPAIGSGLVRAALLAGDEAAALAQLLRLDQGGGGRAGDLLWPCRALLAPPASGLPARLDDYLGALPRAPGRAVPLLAALLEAIGHALPDALLKARGELVPPAETGAIEDAVLAGRRAEVVARVLAMLGTQPLSDLDPARARLAVGALRRVGLEAEARALAIEVALAAGL